MKRKFILLFVILILAVVCIIPVQQEKSLQVKSPFLAVFTELRTPENWKNWRSDFRNAVKTDSTNVHTEKGVNSFIISYKKQKVDVELKDGSYNVSEKNDDENLGYTLTVLPDKTPATAIVAVSSTQPLAKYIISFFSDAFFNKTHVADLKIFMETDSLHYSCNIYKIWAPGTNLIVMQKAVTNSQKFIQASQMLARLHEFMKLNNLTQVKPLIGQSLPKAQDSVQVRVGVFVDKEIPSGKEVKYNHMPPNGPFYVAKYYGPFNKRGKVYTGLTHFFADKQYQSALIPFDSYIDNKLPLSDTDKVNIIVNFPTYY